MIIYSSLSFSLSFSPLLVYSAVIAVSLFDSSSYTFTSHFFSFSLYPIDGDDRGFSVFYKRPLPGVGASKHFGVFSLSINRKLIRRMRQRARAKKDLKKRFLENLSFGVTAVGNASTPVQNARTSPQTAHLLLVHLHE